MLTLSSAAPMPAGEQPWTKAGTPRARQNRVSVPPSPTTGRGVTPRGPAPALRTRCPTISCPGSDQFASMSPVSSSSKRTPPWRPAIAATSPRTSSREIPTGSRKSTSSTHFAGSMLIETPPRTVPTFTDTRRITSAAPAPSESSMAARTSGRSRASRTTEGSSGAFDSIASRSRTRWAASRFALAPVCG